MDTSLDSCSIGFHRRHFPWLRENFRVHQDYRHQTNSPLQLMLIGNVYFHHMSNTMKNNRNHGRMIILKFVYAFEFT